MVGMVMLAVMVVAAVAGVMTTMSSCQQCATLIKQDLFILPVFQVLWPRKQQKLV